MKKNKTAGLMNCGRSNGKTQALQATQAGTDFVYEVCPSRSQIKSQVGQQRGETASVYEVGLHIPG